MKNLSGLPLDDDIICRIFTFLGDLDTLKSAILTSKSFHNVYNSQSSFIRRAVVENFVGPALPQALQVVRCREPRHVDSETEDEDASETDERDSFSNEEIAQLVDNARMFRILEDVFSLRHKNRKFNKSQLTGVESLKFQRAMYRISLYCKKFPGTLTQNLDLGEEEIPATAKAQRIERKKFLSQLSTEELHRIHTVSRFLIEIIEWAQQCETGETEDLSDYLSVGPAVIYECYDEGSMQPLYDVLGCEDLPTDDLFEEEPLLAGFLSRPLRKLFAERNSKTLSDDSSHWDSILDEVQGQDDSCSRCEQVKGFDLWGRTTYKFLYQQTVDLEPGTGLVTLLKGQLSRNAVESRYFRGLVKKIPDAESIYEQVVEELLNSDYKQPEFDDWRADDSLCTDCLTKFLKENLHLWLLDKKIQAGDDVPKDDCWYGWNCRTQTHNADHARKLNHICEPTKGNVAT
ncbi:hypothetical protein E1B28_012726 [Marasmius oreades]|uniref:Aprataxin and PNK-like factor PBZ domain-containing protein n=1 Tax=Marasmius oreades TaxID=181124 RepID=A0A9P7UP90_9AGAR|nr:uncharacterized protein E1B28_012726 [Marasmius oreades]KAG7088760.1 hypothetical protein E1B28_012726 [Marasmius oreades]